MERLTYYSMKGSENDGWYLKPGVTIEMALYRLAAYESTGLMPEEVKLISNVLRAVGEGFNCRTEYAGTALVDLAEHKKAESDGRLALTFPMDKSIGDFIKNARKSAGLTQEALAKELGINRTTILKYEKGMIEPSISQLNKIAKILKMSF